MIAVLTCWAALAMVAWRFAPRSRPRGRASRPTSRRTRIVTQLVLVTIATVALGATAATLVAITSLLTLRLKAGRSLARDRRALERDYPDALELLVLAIRAGELPAAAMQSISPHLPSSVAPAFVSVQQQVDQGKRFADALDALSNHLGPQTQPLVDSLAAADRYGLPLAPVLDRLAFEARQARRRSADTRARQLPVRLSMPLVVCTLPSFVLLAIVPLLLGAISSLSL